MENKMKRKYFKNVCKIFIVLSFLAIMNLFLKGCMTIPIQNSRVDYQPPREFNIDDLNQYGDWINVPEYGNVWKPSVVSDWEPFHNGHWVYSDNNWTWISYEPFGWIVYHYGRWYDDPTYGWVWLPINSGWSPAVVQWDEYDNYISWAPLPPTGITYGNPREEKTRRHWHTVNSDSFLKDDVGRFHEVNSSSNNRDKVLRNSSDVTQNPNNDNSGKTITQPTKNRNNDGERNVNNTSPTPTDIENKTGRKVVNTPVTRERAKTPAENLNTMNLPDSERKRVEEHQPNVTKDVLVPKQNQNSNDKKNENKDSGSERDRKR
jgi:hypothetical protein